eukprot:gene20692-22729_t
MSAKTSQYLYQFADSETPTKRAGLSKRKLPQESDETVRSIIEREIQGPGNLKGYRGMWHKLKTTYGISVARDKVMRLLHAAGPEDSAMRKGRKLTRRCYISPGPNATWHVDGYDKQSHTGFRSTAV